MGSGTNVQYNLHIDDETMKRIMVGGATATALLIVVLIGLIAIDDITGVGTVDDVAIAPLLSALAGDVQYLINYFSQLLYLTSSICSAG